MTKFFLAVSMLAVLTACLPIENSKESHITITGKKPKDSKMELWVDYFISGSDCKSYTIDLFGNKLSDGSVYEIKDTKNYSQDDHLYEMRVNIIRPRNENECSTTIKSITILAKNSFDTQGFAGVRIFNNTKNKKAFSLNDFSSTCNEHLISYNSGTIYGSLNCDYFNNSKILSKDINFPQKIYINLERLGSNAFIKYDIIAGDNYRSEPLLNQK